MEDGTGELAEDDGQVGKDSESDGDSESSSPVWHSETRNWRGKYKLTDDFAGRIYTNRSSVHLRGLPKQLTPDWCFQNECALVHLAPMEVAPEEFSYFLKPVTTGNWLQKMRNLPKPCKASRDPSEPRVAEIHVRGDNGSWIAGLDSS